MKDVVKAKIQDWRVAAGVKDDIENPADLKEHDLEVQFDNDQLYIDLADENGQGLSVIIEINQGKPCIHIGTETHGGDMLIHAFSVDGGLIVTRDNDDVVVSTPKPSRYTYDGNDSIEFR